MVTDAGSGARMAHEPLPGAASMIRPFSFTLIGLCAALCGGSAGADVHHASRHEAQTLVRRALDHYKSVGPDQAWTDFTRAGGAFSDGDLYVYAMDLSGRAVAHGANDRLVGRDLIQLRDVDGKAFVAEILDKSRARSAIWTDYKWPHPVSKEIGARSDYCEAFDAHLFCAGAYR